MVGSWWSEPNSHHAFILAWVSVVLTAIAAVVGIIFYFAIGSALCLVYGLENCVDFLSSVIVLWRFYCPGSVTKEKEEMLEKREERASIGISFILILLGIATLAAAIDTLSEGLETEQDLQVVVIISFISIFVFGSLTVIKFQYSNKLHSASLYKDGICSLIGTCLSCALFINTLIIDNNPDIWWLDPVASIIGGIAAFLIGLWGVIDASCYQKLPIFTLKWWFMSQGHDETTHIHDETADGVMKDDGGTGGGETEMTTKTSSSPENEEKPLSDMV